MFEGEFILASSANNRAILRSGSPHEILDAAQNADPRGLVVRLKDWVYDARWKRSRFKTVSELPAEDFINSGDPLTALINAKRG